MLCSVNFRCHPSWGGGELTLVLKSIIYFSILNTTLHRKYVVFGDMSYTQLFTGSMLCLGTCPTHNSSQEVCCVWGHVLHTTLHRKYVVFGDMSYTQLFTGSMLSLGTCLSQPSGRFSSSLPSVTRLICGEKLTLQVRERLHG